AVGIAPPVEPGASAPPAPAADPRAAQLADPRIVDDPADLPALVQELRAAPLVALQTEPGLTGLAFAVAPGRSWYLSFGHEPREGEFDATPPRNLPPLSSDALAPLRAVLADPTVRKAGHDIKAAWVAFSRAGVPLAGVGYDSMLASFVLNPGIRSRATNDFARVLRSSVIATSAQLFGLGT